MKQTTKNTEPQMDSLAHILDEARLHHLAGDRRALRALLKQAIPHRVAYYRENLGLTRHAEFADLLCKALLLELDEEEEESIELAELAYVSLCEELKKGDADPYEQRKMRVILLHYFADYLTDSIIEIFLKKYREDNLLQARNLALDSIARMQLSDIFHIEQHYGVRIDEDEQLNDICNDIDIAPNLSDQELAEADLMHRVLHAYLKAKYK